MRLLLVSVLLLAGVTLGQYQRHYGYQNPYQYHPYMRYHSYNQEPQPRHHAAHAAGGVEEAKPRHYQHPYQHRAYGGRAASHSQPTHHHQANAVALQHKKPSSSHKEMQRKPAAHHAHRHEPQKKEGEPLYLGTFKNPTHEVKGDIFMLDDHTLYIQGFSFDGQAPDVYFWSDGVPIPYYTRSDNHVTMNVHEYKDEDIVLTLPPEKPTLEKMRKFQVWCKEYGINFGEFSIDS